MASHSPGIAHVGSDGPCTVLTPAWDSRTAKCHMGRRCRNLEGQRYFRWFRRKGCTGVCIPALDAVPILVGFGGEVVSHGLPTKAQVVPLGRLEHLCLCPQGLLS